MRKGESREEEKKFSAREKREIVNVENKNTPTVIYIYIKKKKKHGSFSAGKLKRRKKWDNYELDDTFRILKKKKKRKERKFVSLARYF